MTAILYITAALHAAFMLCEMFPWESPLLLKVVSKKLPGGEGWNDAQREIVAVIVRNAGIYNGVFAVGLAWAAYVGDPARLVAQVLLLGAAVAGAFGTATLKSPIPAVQCVLGILGFLMVSGHS